jgi:hypothetical protein
MLINKKLREQVRQKYNGLCAYTGTELLPNWQVDHVSPLRRNWWLNNSARCENNHKIENMIPTQRIINNYKHSMELEEFRNFMKYFHIRISKLPKNPKTEKSMRRKAYMLEIARLFDITPEKAFSGKFYFESVSYEN